VSAAGYLFNSAADELKKRLQASQSSQSGAAVTGNPYIDATSVQLQEVAVDTLEEMGPGSGPVYGTEFHFEFGANVMALGRPDLFVEQSFDASGLVQYGTDGSIRTDVILGKSPTDPVAIYDLKTGSATLTSARAADIRAMFPGFKGPIIEIKVTTVKVVGGGGG
jgi:hypothetical protein